MDYFTDSQPILKKRKRENPVNPVMPSQFLAAPVNLIRKRSETQTRSRDDVDEFLSSDLELSFASSVSINSPSRENLALIPDSEYAPMDISPLPPQRMLALQSIVPQPVAQKRPRAFTSAARLFTDVSNRSLQPSPSIVDSTKSSSKRTQRAALPTEWLVPASGISGNIFPEPTTDDDAMDVDDSSYADQPAPAVSSFSTADPVSAAPTITTFKNLFYETNSPRKDLESPAQHKHKKRRSLSPESTRYLEDDASSSSPVLPSSPAARKLERMMNGSLLSNANSTKPTLEGLGNPSAGLKRPRRPALSAMVHSSENGLQSAYPILSSDEKRESDLKFPPARRAFSAMIAHSNLDDFSDESSFGSAVDMSSPAQQYAKRQQMKTIRRCDGTDDFRPLTGATAMVLNESSPSSKFMGPGMPGFGDNEAHGKALPCHRVSEDGLMRITAETLDQLLSGQFEAKIHGFHIIDCRFDYEYQGGHIEGAVNINTAAAVEEMLLGPSLFKPKPSVSGDGTKKTVLIFHCEFSAKRAPTFAKHLRAKDRAMNNHVYPKIHYPELYVLEGGYSRYFKESGARCDPPGGYVTMDDPNHAASRRGDLDQFRKAKFGRHKSYAYGELGKPSSTSQQQQVKRNSAPSGGPPSLFAVGNAARTRRVGSTSLLTLPEDGNSTVDGDETDIDLGDSPCPPPTKATALKVKKGTRGPLTRAETYGPGRMPY
ncbi:m-phase inducer phosphatase 3 [Moniliophthora roreri MCA 2997]|uniref:M-phase inducer phosphatase n=2 Tax=Moniliophthora roreri TaxID=221103 RepID=V2YYY5_MONRO|nr:m-phase inducer phosphatase 3 [Moniliophthora roreri MCA 2997]